MGREGPRSHRRGLFVRGEFNVASKERKTKSRLPRRVNQRENQLLRPFVFHEKGEKGTRRGEKETVEIRKNGRNEFLLYRYSHSQ